MKLIFLVAILIAIPTTTTFSLVYAQSLSKHNPGDVCKSAKNIQNLTQKVTYCIDAKTKQKYIPQEAPTISTDGIFSAPSSGGGGGDNSTDFIMLNDKSSQNEGTTNMSLSSTIGPKATHLIPVDMSFICSINDNKNCAATQNEFITQNLTSSKDVSGNWIVSGAVEYDGNLPITKLTLTVNFYTAKGVQIGGLVIKDLKAMQPFETQAYSVKTIKTNPKIVPAFFSVSYQGEKSLSGFGSPLKTSLP